MITGSLSLIKELNTSVILNTIKDNESISRAEIALLTGLTPATVTNLTAKLLDKKLIKETTLGESSGGRKPVMLEINYGEYNTACVSISSNYVMISVFDLKGNLLSSVEINPEDKSSEVVLDEICKELKNLISASSKRVLGIGVSCEGMIDVENGICVFSANLGWENIHLKEKLFSELKIPVFVDNDVQIIALGEKWYGAARDNNDFLLIYTGYGIGTAIMSGGKLYRGVNNYAGELGHTTLDPEGPVCSCGNRGCLQAFASISALEREIKKKGSYQGESRGIDKLISDFNEGEPALTELFEKQAYYIGIAAANAINMFNPSEIIFNGYITRLKGRIKDIISEQIKERCLKVSKSIKIIYSELNKSAVYKGAAALVVENLFANPSVFFGWEV